MVVKGGNIVIYQDFILYITLFVLLKIYTQYRCLANKLQPLSPCTHSFTNIIGLPYIHKIEVSIIFKF